MLRPSRCLPFWCSAAYTIWLKRGCRSQEDVFSRALSGSCRGHVLMATPSSRRDRAERPCGAAGAMLCVDYFSRHRAPHGSCRSHVMVGPASVSASMLSFWGVFPVAATAGPRLIPAAPAAAAAPSCSPCRRRGCASSLARASPPAPITWLGLRSPRRSLHSDLER